MQLTCPSCYTVFHIDPSDLGEGRTVRCTRCRTTWFARPSDASPAPVVTEILAEGEAFHADAGGTAAGLAPQVVRWNDTVMVEINPSPSLAPALFDNIDAPAVQISRLARLAGPLPVVRRKPARRDSPQKRFAAITVMIAAILLAAVSYRTAVVRYVPGLADLYAAAGLPVNLRGLEFKAVKTSQENQDGVPVLVIEGEIVNITRQAVEVPRLRLAVMGAGDRELYAWTALLPRAVLPEGESLPFRSRLASPPSDGREVLVRFLNRLDLTANVR